MLRKLATIDIEDTPTPAHVPVPVRAVIAAGLSAADQRDLEHWAAWCGLPWRTASPSSRWPAPSRAPSQSPSPVPALPLLALIGCAPPHAPLPARVAALRASPCVVVGVGAREHISVAFAAGCDEYLASPICVAELVVRLTRHAPASPPPSPPTPPAWNPATAAPRAGEERLAVDAARAELLARGARLRLRPSELRLLEYLGSAADRTVTAAEIVQNVLGANGDGGSARTLIWNLRRRMRAAACEDLLVNVRGHGYRLAEGARWVGRSAGPSP